MKPIWTLLKILVLAGIALFVVGVISVMNYSPDKDSPRVQTRADSLMTTFGKASSAHILLEKKIRQGMHNPRSYDFDDWHYQDKGETVLLTIEYRGTNAFGGIVKGQTTGEFTRDGIFIRILK